MSDVTVLALHGFGGAGRSWDPVRRALAAPAEGRPSVVLRAPDLRGHGTRAAVRPVTLDAVLRDLEAELEAIDGPVVLAGYSMGGRIALHLALRRPERLAALVLVSATSGIADPVAREERRASDERLARRLEREGAPAFADFWGTLPLWDGDPHAARRAQRDELAAGDAAGLAAALRGLGSGVVPAVGDRVATLPVPLAVVVGARDERYRTIATVLLERAAQPAGEVVLADTGHGVLREAPAALAAVLGRVAWRGDGHE
ncbi:MAG: alpha/beta fold hydrolase [Solirubrobacteraceae bacterium]